MKLVLVTILILILSACSTETERIRIAKEPEQPEVIDIAKILKNKKIPQKEKSEKLVVEAEKLVTPIGFMFAHKILKQALEADPNNKKAEFYLAMLEPWMNFKGIFKRIEPLMQKGRNEELKAYHDMIKELKSGGLKDFLLDGSPDITSESKLQDFVSESILTWDKLRKYLMANKDLVLKVQFNLVKSEATSNCYVTELKSNIYQSSPCDYIYTQKRRVDRADIEILQQIAAGQQILSIFLSTYEATGLQEVHFQKKEFDLTEEGIVHLLESQQNFGHLRDDHSSPKIVDLGADIYGGAKWAYKLQEKLCPIKKRSHQMNRPGYLMNRGVCISDKTKYGLSTNDIFTMLELALSGQSQLFEFRDSYHRKTSEVITKAEFNPMNLFLNPQENVKQLFPSQFDRCGRATKFKDASFGGAFSDSDFNNVVGEIKAFRDNKIGKDNGCM